VKLVTNTNNYKIGITSINLDIILVEVLYVLEVVSLKYVSVASLISWVSGLALSPHMAWVYVWHFVIFLASPYHNITLSKDRERALSLDHSIQISFWVYQSPFKWVLVLFLRGTAARIWSWPLTSTTPFIFSWCDAWTQGWLYL